MALVVLIGATTLNPNPVETGITVTETLNGRNLLALTRDDVLGAYRPSPFDDITLTLDGTRLFKGTVLAPEEMGFGGVGLTGLTHVLDATDRNALADRRHVSLTYDAGWELGTVLTELLAYLPGVTLDAGFVAPALAFDFPLAFDYVTVSEALTTLAGYAGRVWEITYHDVLRMFVPGAEAAAFDIDTDADTYVIGDIQVTPNIDAYANRVILRAGTGVHAVEDERHDGDGSTRDFTLTLPVKQLTPALVHHVDPTYGINAWKNVGTYPATGLMWRWDAATNQIRQRGTDTPLSASGYITVSYDAQMPLVVTADDAAEQAAHGIWDAVVDAPDCFVRATAEALVAVELAKRVVAPRIITYETYTGGLHPGQTQHVTCPERDLDDDFLITDVVMEHVRGTLWRYRITAVEGSTNPSTWRDTYRSWSGTGGGGSVSTVGSGAVVSTSAPMAIDLGGDGLQMVRSATPTWVAASAKRMYVDASDRASVDVTVVCRVRARDAGVSVQPRLYNVTAGAAAGTGAAVTNTAWQDQTFAATLAEGAHWYELQLLPGAANKDVAGVGYAELQ